MRGRHKAAIDVAMIVADEGEVTIKSLAEEVLGCSKATAYSYLSLAVELGLLKVDRVTQPFRFYSPDHPRRDV